MASECQSPYLDFDVRLLLAAKEWKICASFLGRAGSGSGAEGGLFGLEELLGEAAALA